MENIPKELEETQLNLQVVIDPTAKYVTMKTHMDETRTNVDVIPDIIPKDPLQEEVDEDEPDLDNMNELDKLIYTERQRMLNVKLLHKPNKTKTKDVTTHDDNEADAVFSLSDLDSNADLEKNPKWKIRRLKQREQETADEQELRKFRQRIVTMKIRLLQRLNNFDDETYFKEIRKRNTDRIQRKRKELKEKETPEQRAQRKSRLNITSRLAKIRRKAFKTPEELLHEKEKRLENLDKYWARKTEEERSICQKVNRDKARERYKKNHTEWNKYNMILKGVNKTIKNLEESETN